jgi:hypothetical protein
VEAIVPKLTAAIPAAARTRSLGACIELKPLLGGERLLLQPPSNAARPGGVTRITQAL